MFTTTRRVTPTAWTPEGFRLSPKRLFVDLAVHPPVVDTRLFNQWYCFDEKMSPKIADLPPIFPGQTCILLVVLHQSWTLRAPLLLDR
jgi:hypothetical protein